jgi:hypothetical protein
VFPYWIIFAIPALIAVSGRDSWRMLRGATKPAQAMVLFGALLCVFIGLRHETGGDWFNYAGHLKRIASLSLTEALALSDPGYRLLLWVSQQLDLGLYGVNFFASTLFCAGLVRFCSRQPRPWLAMAVAVPYLVIVVAMGYSRQALALGCALLALVALEDKRNLTFIVWILVATTFHRTAILMLPIVLLVMSRNRILTLVAVVAIGAGAYMVFVERDIDSLYLNYIEKTYQSQGALIRLGMNSFAAFLFLVLSRRMGLSGQGLKLWRWISIFSLILIAVYFFMPGSSAALDRIGLYFLPIQIVALSRLPMALSKDKMVRHLLAFGVVAGYAAALFVWLNFAKNAYAWLPYKMYLFGAVL